MLQRAAFLSAPERDVGLLQVLCSVFLAGHREHPRNVQRASTPALGKKEAVLVDLPV